jgi:hypothetical protein
MCSLFGSDVSDTVDDAITLMMRAVVEEAAGDEAAKE